MESFRWDQSFLTGIADVDDQHHHLVNVINRFGELISGKETPRYSEVEVLFKELTEYTQYHFSEEEAFMEQAAIDPRYLEPHKKAHQHFINEVLKMSRTITPETMDRCDKVMKFLIHWLAYHILGTDKSMSRQISQIEAGVSPADAYEQEQLHQESSTGPLLTALTGLFQQVSESNQELYLLNQTLEQRVEERTRDLASANHKLEVIALTDALTGLPNRRHALKAFEQLWQESSQANTPLCCMMIDADYFKQINDTYGHDAGDEVLRQLSHTLKHSVRNDDITARLGGDEFLIICPDTDLKGGLLVAEKMRQTVNALSVPAGEDGEWKGSVSVGVSCRTADMKGPDNLIKEADNGVYMAKEEGRNCIRTSQKHS